LDIMGTLEEGIIAQAPPAIMERKPANEESPNVQEVNQDLLAMLAGEIAANHDALAGSLAVAMSADAKSDAQQAALEDYCEQWSRMALASESIGLTALAAASTLLTDQLQTFPLPLTAPQAALLDAWSLNLQDYFVAPQDAAICQSLASVLQNGLWPEALTSDQAAALADALGALTFSSELPGAETRATVAQPEDVSLAVAGDINPELLDGLLHELPIQIGALSASIECMAAGDASLKDIERAQRAAHTLKGAANTVGVRGIANLTHHLEDILVALTKHEALPDHALCLSLTNAADCLEAMSEVLLGASSEPENSVEVLQEVLDWANRIDREGITASEPESAFPMASKNASAAPEAVHEAEHVAVPMLRVPAPIVDEQLRLVGESIIANSQLQDRLQKSIAQSKQISRQSQLLEQLVVELENLVDIRGITRGRVLIRISIRWSLNTIASSIPSPGV
jgi:chemosensory pili system protein ChpA (sensor histidine kinase/response regulator)